MRKFLLLVIFAIVWLTSAITDKYQTNKQTRKIQAIEQIKKAKEADAQNQAAQTSQPQINQSIDYAAIIESNLRLKLGKIDVISSPKKILLEKPSFGLQAGQVIEHIEVIYTNQANEKQICIFVFYHGELLKIVE